MKIMRSSMDDGEIIPVKQPPHFWEKYSVNFQGPDDFQGRRHSVALIVVSLTYTLGSLALDKKNRNGFGGGIGRLHAFRFFWSTARLRGSLPRRWLLGTAPYLSSLSSLCRREPVHITVCSAKVKKLFMYAPSRKIPSLRLLKELVIYNALNHIIPLLGSMGLEAECDVFRMAKKMEEAKTGALRVDKARSIEIRIDDVLIMEDCEGLYP